MTQVTSSPVGSDRLALAIRKLSPSETVQAGGSNTWLGPGRSACGTQSDSPLPRKASVKTGFPVDTHFAPATVGIPSVVTPRSSLMVSLATSAPLAVRVPIINSRRKKQTFTSGWDRTSAGYSVDCESRNGHRPTLTLTSAASYIPFLAHSAGMEHYEPKISPLRYNSTS